MSTPALLKLYAADPMRFIDDLVIRAGGELRRFGDVMAPFQRERFADLLPAFQAVAQGRQPSIPRHWWEATKGASKDSDLAAALLWLLIFSPRALHVQIGAADRDQADELRRAAKTWLSQNEWLGQLIEIQASCILHKPTGSEAEIIAADVAGSHGARPDVLILNELSHVTKEEFALNLLDNASKVPGGVVVIATNAGYTGTWQFALREQARANARWAFHKFTEPAPWLTGAEIEDARKRNPPARYARLWKGIWSAGTGDAIDPDAVESCIMLDGPEPSTPDGFDALLALDLGVKHDRSAVAVIGVNCVTDEVRLLACKSWSPREHGGQVNLQVVEDEVAGLFDRYKANGVLYDPWQAMHLAQRLTQRRVHMIEFPATAANLDLMARELMSVFRNREVKLYSDAELVQDLCSMSLVERANGTFKLIAARTATGHSDKGFAFAMGLARAKEFSDAMFAELSARKQAEEEAEQRMYQEAFARHPLRGLFK